MLGMYLMISVSYALATASEVHAPSMKPYLSHPDRTNAQSNNLLHSYDTMNS